MPVTFSDLGWTPTGNLAETDRERLKELLEFPRILIWKPEEFANTNALSCIEFHETCCFPLFWLDPKRLRVWDPAQNQLSSEVRQLISHDTVFALTDRNWAPVTRAPEVWANEAGNLPEIEPGRIMDRRIDHIWRQGVPPRVFHLGAEPLIEEFKLLLSRPDIMFAADAWAMYRLGQEHWNDLQTAMNRIDLSKWYD